MTDSPSGAPIWDDPGRARYGVHWGSEAGHVHAVFHLGFRVLSVAHRGDRGGPVASVRPWVSGADHVA